MSKNVLAVVAHPDDEILGCGGTISKHTAAGDRVRIVVLAEGITARDSQKQSIAAREKEFYSAAEIVGVSQEDCRWLGLPDQRLDTLPLLDIVKKVEQITAAVIPDIVYTHHWGDINRDHRLCCEAVTVAFRPGRAGAGKTSIFCFEIHGNMNCFPPLAVNEFAPDHYVDISDHFQTKIKAFRTYKDELREYPSPLSIRALEELSKERAKSRQFEYAEAFATLRKA